VARAIAGRVYGKKLGRALSRLDRERIAAPEVYGTDRVFVYVHTEHATDVVVDAKVAALEKAGTSCSANLDGPTSMTWGAGIFSLGDRYPRGGRLHPWNQNAFNQPDVEASQDRDPEPDFGIRKETVPCPRKKPVLEDSGVKLFTDEKNSFALGKRAAAGDKSPRRVFESTSESHSHRRLLCSTRIYPK